MLKVTVPLLCFILAGTQVPKVPATILKPSLFSLVISVEPESSAKLVNPVESKLPKLQTEELQVNVPATFTSPVTVSA